MTCESIDGADVRDAWLRRAPRAIGCACIACASVLADAASAATNVLQYTYDAAGNIVAIRRANAAPIAILAFAPSSGPVGTIVTISGVGFAPTPAGNAVTFNGVAATVAAATATTLTALVPSGATTGKIAVTVAGGNATSPQDFTVIPPGAPTIAGFTPTMGPAGTQVTIVGTNFDPAIGGTTAKLNGSTVTATSVTTTQLAITVPAATASGALRVTTSAGSAVSTADFIVPPPGIAATDVVSSARLQADSGSRTLGVFAFDKVGLILFDGNAGDWLSLQFGNYVINPVGATTAYAIYKPDNTQLSSGTLSATDLTINVPPLPAAGTYTVVLRSGTTQVSLDARLETNRLLPGDGSALAVARGAGQSMRVLVAAAAGEQKALSIAALTNAPAGASLSWQITLPNGATFRKGMASGFGDTALWPSFTTAGTYALVLWPTTFTTQTSYQLALLPGAVLPIDGTAQDVALSVPGGGARLDFAGIAGENLGLGVTGAAPGSAAPIGCTVSVYKPDASVLVSTNCQAGGTQCAANLANLPVTGKYTIVAQPWSGATGTLQFWLSHDVAGTLASAMPKALALARPGQNARLTFAAAAGAQVAIQVRGVASAPVGQGIFAQILRPDGAWHAFMHVTGAGQTLVAPPLPVTGTYTLFVEPESAALGAATATMEVLLDPGQGLAIDGPTVASAVAVPGGSARYTFGATAGQSLGLGIGNLALSGASGAAVSVYRPDGTPLTEIGCAANPGMCGANLANLPATGTYQLVVRPSGGATGTLSATLSTDLAGTLTVGSALPVSVDRPGRNMRLTFAGTIGQLLRLAWSDVAISGTTAGALVYAYRPDGATLVGSAFANGATGGIDLPALPVTGAYTVFVDPPLGGTMKATLKLLAR